MTITAKIQEKIDAYRTHVLIAIDNLSKGRLDEAAVRLRMSAEAYMKAIIYEHLGDTLGHEVILARKFQDGSVRSRGHSLLTGLMLPRSRFLMISRTRPMIMRMTATIQ